MTPKKQEINFTIIPDEESHASRTYSNFCAIAHTPFDVTLTFCEVMPLSQKDVEEAKNDRVVRAPVRAKIVLPMQFVPTLITTLQEHVRALSEQTVTQSPEKAKGPVH